eukprot:Gb_19677 [translate_table: standard]
MTSWQQVIDNQQCNDWMPCTYDIVAVAGGGILQASSLQHCFGMKQFQEGREFNKPFSYAIDILVNLNCVMQDFYPRPNSGHMTHPCQFLLLQIVDSAVMAEEFARINKELRKLEDSMACIRDLRAKQKDMLTSASTHSKRTIGRLANNYSAVALIDNAASAHLRCLLLANEWVNDHAQLITDLLLHIVNDHWFVTNEQTINVKAAKNYCICLLNIPSNISPVTTLERPLRYYCSLDSSLKLRIGHHPFKIVGPILLIHVKLYFIAHPLADFHELNGLLSTFGS